jgi:cyclopropane-fatty-acyl-phospholipid synthase
MLDTLLQSLVKEGKLIVRLPGARSVAVNGAQEDDSPLTVRILDHKTLAHIARDPALAVGEAYMAGRFLVERGTLYDFLLMVTRNMRKTRAIKPRFKWLRKRRNYTNKPQKARKNVASHYDLSGELYRLFLDSDRQYSCAYFPDPGMSLEEAQVAKKRHLAGKLLLKPGHRVLDIGSGWGGLGLMLAEEHGAEVLGVTLSSEQLAEARERAAKRGLERRVRFEMLDYRAIEGQFDRIVSVGMFEHVGPGNYQDYFNALSRLLEHDGIAVVHTIARYDQPNLGNPWIEKYIFPGGYLPSLSDIAPAVEQSGLILTDLEILRTHYAETLRAWRERFYAHREQVRRLYDERFIRMWDFYLSGAEAGFREGTLVVFQMQFAKQRETVPQTRDYITDFDREGQHLHAIAAE